MNSVVSFAARRDGDQLAETLWNLTRSRCVSRQSYSYSASTSPGKLADRVRVAAKRLSTNTIDSNRRIPVSLFRSGAVQLVASDASRIGAAAPKETYRCLNCHSFSPASGSEASVDDRPREWFIARTRARSAELADYIDAAARRSLSFDVEHPIEHSSHNGCSDCGGEQFGAHK